MKYQTTNTKGATAPRRKVGNVLDLIILLLLVAAIIAVGYRYYTRSGHSRSDLMTDAVVTFEIRDAVFTLPGYVRAGDAVYREDGTQIGTLRDNNVEDENTALYFTAAAVITKDEDGNYISIAYPDSSRVDCIGTLVCRGTVGEDGAFLLDGTTHLTPGETLRLHTETAAFTVVITDCSVAAVGGN